MKQIKRGMLKRCNSLIAWVLSLAGIACTNIACEYGTPEAKFNVSGTVTSEESGEPIDHIQVTMGYDTVYSDQAGKYKISTYEFPVSQDFIVNFSDVDGTANGEFSPLDTLAQFKDPEFHDGSGSWYEGEADQEIKVKLKIKN